MNVSKYLIIAPGRKSWNPSVKIVTSLKGTMPSNAIAIRLNLQLPDSLFKKPQLEATIKINDSDVNKPVINAQVLDNITATFKQQLGFDVTVNVMEPKEEQ